MRVASSVSEKLSKEQLFREDDCLLKKKRLFLFQYLGKAYIRIGFQILKQSLHFNSIIMIIIILR